MPKGFTAKVPWLHEASSTSVEGKVCPKGRLNAPSCEAVGASIASGPITEHSWEQDPQTEGIFFWDVSDFQ